MGVIITGTNDNIKAADGSLSIEGFSIKTTGIGTFDGGVQVGTAATISANGNATFSGIVTTAQLGGDVLIEDKIVHVGDTNTAIRFPSADTFSTETGGSEALRVDSSQRLLVGSTSSRIAGDVTAQLQVEGTSYNTSSLTLIANSGASSGNQSHITLAKSRGSSDGSDTIVVDGDSIGLIQWAASDGTDLNCVAAEIRSKVNGTPGSNDMPGSIEFGTTADGAVAPTTRLTIDSSGRVDIGIPAAVTQTRNLNIGSDSEANLAIETHNDATSETANIRFYKSGNTGASPQVVETNDNIAQLQAYGYDGTDYACSAGAIKFSVDGAPGSNDMPGKIILATTADGATSPTDRLTIGADGNVTVSTGNLVMGTSGKGIDFAVNTSGGGTSSATVFEDYEEGTFTPRMAGTTNGGSYWVNGEGHYTKIGNWCHVVIRFNNVDLNDSASGTIKFDTMPYTASHGGATNAPAGVTADFQTYEVDFETDKKHSFYISSGNSEWHGLKTRNGDSWQDWGVNDFDKTGTYINWSGTYRTA